MSRDVVWTARFKRDYKLAMKQNMDMTLLDDCIRVLASGAALPSAFRDHSLSGDWIGFRECHIKPDWLLVYRIDGDGLVLVLARTGSHSELFH